MQQNLGAKKMGLGPLLVLLQEHGEVIACVKRQDAEGAARIIAQHVAGSGRHLIEHMRAARASGVRGLP